MSKLPLYISLLVAAALVACSSGSNGNEKSKNEEHIEEGTDDFAPEAGMPLQDLAGLPGVTWVVDTIKGVCVPDTLVLWAVYGDKAMPTNVRGNFESLPNITDTGKNVFLTSDSTLNFSKSDFKASAKLAADLDKNRGAFKHDVDSVYEKRLKEMTGIARDFFTSYGMAKYMAQPLAEKWQRKYKAAEADGSEAPNPFNGSFYVEFDTGDINVDVVDAENGDVIVRTYCIDENTLGYEGWAQWEMQMTKEGRQFKVKTLPKLHR